MRPCKIFLLLTIMLITGDMAFTQPLVDSVDNVINSRQGAERLQAIPGCMVVFYQHKPPYLEKVLELGNKGIKLAEQLDDKKRQAIINLHMARGYYHMGIYDNRPKTHLLTAITLCEKTGNTHGAGICNMYLGEVFRSRKEYHKATEYYQKAIKLLNRYARDELKMTYSNLGACYMQLDDYKNALDCYTKAMPYVPKDDLETQANIYNNTGAIYETLKNYDFALQHYQKCLDIKTQLNDKKRMARSYNNIGNVYKAKRQNKKALGYYKKSLELWQLLADKYEEAITLNNIGLVHKQEGEYDIALQYYKKALKIFTELGETKKITAVLNNIASATAAMKKPEEAIAQLDSIMAYVEKQNDPSNLKIIYLNFSELFEAKGNAGKALEYARSYESILANLHNIDINKLAVLQRDYQLLEKEKELEVARRDNQLNKARVRQRTIIIFALAGFFILLSIIAILTHMSFRLRVLHKLADLKSRLLRSQMNPHFLFNALMAIQHKVLKGENDTSIQYISVLARLLRQVLEVSNEEYISIEKETDILERYFEMQQLRYGDRFDYTIRINPGVDPGATGIPPMLLQPLVENAIEHGVSNIPYKGLIEVEFGREKGMLVCTVADNGIGINRHKEKNDNRDKDHESFALGIVSERLDILGKRMRKKASMEIIDLETRDKDSRGTLVMLKIPGKEFY